MVERWSYVPEVAGSTPAWSSFGCDKLINAKIYWCKLVFMLCASLSCCQLSLVAEHLLCKQKVGSSILPAGFFLTCNVRSIWWYLTSQMLLNKEPVCITICMVPRGLMDMASDYESGDSGFESRRGSIRFIGIHWNHMTCKKSYRIVSLCGAVGSA